MEELARAVRGLAEGHHPGVADDLAQVRPVGEACPARVVSSGIACSRIQSTTACGAGAGRRISRSRRTAPAATSTSISTSGERSPSAAA